MKWAFLQLHSSTGLMLPLFIHHIGKRHLWLIIYGTEFIRVVMRFEFDHSFAPYPPIDRSTNYYKSVIGKFSLPLLAYWNNTAVISNVIAHTSPYYVLCTGTVVGALHCSVLSKSGGFCWKVLYGQAWYLCIQSGWMEKALGTVKVKKHSKRYMHFRVY